MAMVTSLCHRRRSGSWMADIEGVEIRRKQVEVQYLVHRLRWASAIDMWD